MCEVEGLYSSGSLFLCMPLCEWNTLWVLYEKTIMNTKLALSYMGIQNALVLAEIDFALEISIGFTFSSSPEHSDGKHHGSYCILKW